MDLSIPEIIQYGGTIEAIKERLTKGEDINQKKEATPLIMAIHMQRDEVAEMLLDEGADIHITCHIDLPPLYYAARNGSYTLVKRLVEAGAEINKPYTFTPLIAAFNDAHKFFRKNLEVFEEINGKKVKITDQERIDAIAGKDRYANFPKIVKLLIEKGADINAITSTGQTALHYAGDHGEYELAKIAFEIAKPEVNRQDYYGLTALHFACRKGHKAVAGLLLDNGADPNAQENYGFTPLHEAAENGHAEIAKLLIEHQADPSLQLTAAFDPYSKGFTALDVAKAKRHTDVIKILS